MFTLADGRERIYQWDSNVKLLLDESAMDIDEAHFSTKFSREMLPVKVVRSEGEAYVTIPNILLQKSYDIIVYAYCCTSGCTKHVDIFEVEAKAKPADYVYTETELLNYRALADRITRIEETGGVSDEQIDKAFSNYLEKNPIVTPDLTAQVERAETAAREAETANNTATSNASTAVNAANSANTFATQAASAASAAGQSETNAENAADRAEEAADRAEEAAANGGNNSGGNVDLTGVVKSVNGKTPDANGNVEITVSGGSVGDLSTNPIIVDILRRLGVLEGYHKTETAIYNLPVLNLTGDTTGISKDNEVTVDIELLDIYGEPLFTGKKASLGWQGSSSINYDKKNYSIKLYEADGETKFKYKAFEDVVAMSSYHIKANFIDFTQARNIVTVRMVKDAYVNPLTNARNCIDGFPIIVNLNGEKQGLYTFNLKQDEKVYGFDEENPNHLMYRAELNDAGTTCSFRALSTNNAEGCRDWEDRFPATNTVENRAKLNRLIQWVMDCEGNTDKFKNEVSNYLNVDYLIDYWLWCYLSGATDSLAKNMCLTTYDGNIWYPMFYDADSTWGISWQGGSKAFDIACPSDYQCTDSLLWELTVLAFEDEIRARYEELRETFFTVDSIVGYFSDFMEQIAQEEYDFDKAKWNPPSVNYGLDYISNWVENRLIYMDEQMKAVADVGDYVKDGLIAEYDLRNVSAGATTVADLSGNGHDITLHGTFDDSAYRADGLYFDGATSYATIAALGESNKDLCIEIVVMLTEDVSTWPRIFNPGGDYYRAAMVGVDPVNLLYACGYNSGNRNISKPQALNEYCAVSMNLNSTKCEYYKNGVFLANGETVNESNYTGIPTAITLGANPNHSKDFFKGVISSLRIYNRNLSASEIHDNYQVESAKF